MEQRHDTKHLSEQRATTTVIALCARGDITPEGLAAAVEDTIRSACDASVREAVTRLQVMAHAVASGRLLR